MANQVVLASAQHMQGLLESKKVTLSQLLPKGMDADRVIKTVLMQLVKKPELQQCTASSVVLSVMQAAELGLAIGDARGHAYLVAFKGQCTLIAGYRGMIDLATRTGKVLSIDARLVHDKDEFMVEFGTNPSIKHIPTFDGDVRFAYAIALLASGAVMFDVMTRKELDSIRNRSKAKDKNGNLVGPWVTDCQEMQRKTVIRRLWKYLPMSEQMAQICEIEDAVTGMDEVIDVEVGLPVPPEGKLRKPNGNGDAPKPAPATPPDSEAPPSADSEEPSFFG